MTAKPIIEKTTTMKASETPALTRIATSGEKGATTVHTIIPRHSKRPITNSSVFKFTTSA